MRRLFKKLKLKQVMAWLLLFCTVMSTFVTSISRDVSANSNDIRRVGLSLAKGDTLSTIGVENIDENTLQVISLYLSNFYVPFMTVLDGDYSYEDSSNTGNDGHLDSMKKALITELGMNRQAAEFIVQYSLSESLNTCSPLYMRKNDLEEYWLKTGININDTSIGFYGTGCIKSDTHYDDYDADEWNLDNDGVNWATNSGLGHYDESEDGFDAYCEAMGVVKGSVGTKDNVSFVPVTYPIFLTIMNYSYRTASYDTIADDEQFSVSSTYDITNRTDNDPDEDLDVDNNDEVASLSDIPRADFYYLDSSRSASVVFSNSEECMQAYAMVNSGLDYKHGWGSAFSMFSSTNVEAITSKSDTSVNGCVAGSKLYINWEGSIILDTGTYRTPIFPGSANPHMLTTLEGNINANTIPLQNIWGIGLASNGCVDTITGCDGSTNVKALSVYSEGSTLFNLRYWREHPASDNYKFDNNSGFLPGYGEWDSLFDVLESTDYFETVDIYDKDVFIFPNWTNIANSSTYRGADKDGNYTRFAARDLFGHPVLSTDIVYLDDINGVSSSATISDIFKTQDISDTSFLNDLGVNALNPYATFTNVTDIGHTASYSVAQQKCFRSLFFTYCFAYFNQKHTSFTKETNIINLRTNFDNYPTYNSAIDWSTLYADTLQDQVLSFAYYVLHPTEGINYVATLLKNKVGGFLLRCHDDMVGSTDSNSSTGMTKYLSTSSYTTTSGLYDVPWIAKLLDIYDSLIVYMIILMCLVLLCYIITGSMSLSRGIVGVIIFALLAFIPPFAINTTVNVSNTFSDKIYSEKFDYWALTQLETWLQSYEDAQQSRGDGDFGSYAAFVLNNQALTSSGIAGDVSTTYSGVKVKWMTPKKYNSLSVVANQINSIDTDAEYLKTLMLNAVHSATSGETYLESDSALYLYRDYIDIYEWGSITYNVINTYNFNNTLNNKSIVTGSKYFNLVPADKVSGVNTIINAWTSSKDKVNKITSDFIYKDYVLENCDYSNDNTAKSLASSISHVDLGFLYDTISSTSSGSNYYYDVNKGGNYTLATTYLALYNENILRIHQKHKALQNICDGTAKLQLDDYALLTAKGDALTRSITGDTYFNYGGNQHNLGTYADFKLGIDDLKHSTDIYFNNAKKAENSKDLYRQLSSMYYSLYAESPYYYFNYNVRDQLSSFGYSYNTSNIANASSKVNNLGTLFVKNNQDYFYNLSDNAGDGYGELRDFMNMHDMFYYIMPMLKEGVDLARLYDDTFGLYLDEDCSLSFNIENSTGLDTKFTYNGKQYNELIELKNDGTWKDMTEEERYKFWHSYNTYTILLNYTAWLDTMMDCDYADSETIHIMGDRFTVEEPLNPYSYFETDNDGNIIKGRLMIFSRSEMAYYGLTEADLTTVEQKIIDLQDNVYAATLDLMNYYTLSDETLIQAYAMIQTFEFNKIFSQNSLIGESFTLYPQGYELKGFSYDAYLRMIIAEASGEPLMTGGTAGEDGTTTENSSIYKRVLENTSLLFAFFLLINDVLAVYLIPGLKLFFIICIFITSVLIIIGSSIKMELNMMKVMWQSLFAPLLSFAGVNMGMSWLVSMFMGNGANGVVSSSAIIDLGDPTATIIVMIIINAGATILYFKICKKCFHDLKTYGKAVFDNIGSTIVGAVGTVTGALSNGSARDRVLGKNRGSSGSNVSNTAKQRGQDNMPTSGKNGLGVAAGALGAGAAGDLLSDKEKRQAGIDAKRRDTALGMNKYDKTAYEGANKKADNLLNQAERLDTRVTNAKGLNKKRLEVARDIKLQRSLDHENYAKNVAEHGKFKAGIMQAGYHGKNIGNKVSKGASKAKSRLAYMTSEQGLEKASKNVGASITSARKGLANAPKQVGSGVRKTGNSIKKGYNSTINTVKSTPKSLLNKGGKALNGVKNRGSAIGRGLKSGLGK